jgi:5-methylcytosine-specific restriction endonuclease McrA
MPTDVTRISVRTLLLNATYEPLRVISWQRAVTMSYLGKVEVLRSYEQVLRSVSARVETPAVVRLFQIVRRHRTRISFSRRNVFLRDGYRCQYCGISLPAAELTTDHVLPRSLGGATTWENVVTACSPCNLRKGGRTPTQARMALHRRPHRPTHLPPMAAVAMSLHGDGAPPVWREFLVLAGAVEAMP